LIQDITVLDEIRMSWHGVREFREKLQRAVLASFAFGGLPQPFLADAGHNLPLLHAFAVLNEVLQQLRDEGHFTCKGFFLGALMNASADALPWVDFALVKEGVARRNDVAHKGMVLPRTDCWKYIDAVETQLREWNVVV
jgi:hypothetical protein